MIQDIYIHPKVSGKGRVFRATCVATLVAPSTWDGGNTSSKDRIDRPVMAIFAGSENELRPFVANLTLGRPATFGGGGRRESGVEFLKSAGYKFIWQREAEGSVVTAFLPELFLLDPGMVDPKVARFIAMPSANWAAQQKGINVSAMVRHARRLPLVKKINAPPEESWRRNRFEPPLPDDALAALAPTAYLFAAYLDRRTRAPIPADGRFYLQLLLACLHHETGIATLATSDYFNSHDRGSKFGRNFKFVDKGCADAGFLPGVAFRSDHEALETLLAQEVATFQIAKDRK